MSWYTPEQRRRGLATRRRNARLRREEAAKKGIELNPTVKLSDDVVVTEAVKRRLNKKAKSDIPLIGSFLRNVSYAWPSGVIFSGPFCLRY